MAERRFGGLARLYGTAAYQTLRTARVAVVGVGGVGSWAAEALARCGVAALVLIDLDHVAESNINRQLQATSLTLGQAKVQALRERMATIHPGCDVVCIEEFVEPGNWPALLPFAVDVVIDACDQVKAKFAMASQPGMPVVCVGAAGGKREPQRVEVADLSMVTHDPLLAALRNRLRREAGAPRQGGMGLSCVFSRETVLRPLSLGSQAPGQAEGEIPSPAQGDLSCHGYGSSVMVTASFGMAAAAEAVRIICSGPQSEPGA